MTYSHMGTPTLPSALLRFTSEFGMGSGGSKVLLSPDKNFYTWMYLCRDAMDGLERRLHVFNNLESDIYSILNNARLCQTCSVDVESRINNAIKTKCTFCTRVFIRPVILVSTRLTLQNLLGVVWLSLTGN